MLMFQDLQRWKEGQTKPLDDIIIIIDNYGFQQEF